MSVSVTGATIHLSESCLKEASGSTSVEGDGVAAAHAAAQQLDNDHPSDVLEALVANGGLDPDAGVSGVDPEQESQS